MCGSQKLQLNNTRLIRFAGIRVRAAGAFVRVAQCSSDRTLGDSAAMLSTNSQRIGTSESEPSSSSTAWSDPDVSESHAACASLRDTSSSLLWGLGRSFNDRTIRDNLASDEPELSLPDNQFGPITVFIERGRDGWPIQICFSAPLLLADAKCG
jgi:hypothetical protein